MPHFDFDTRKPHEPNQPKRVRIESFANKLRSLFIATRSRMMLIANRVQSLLIANRLRTLLIGGGILLFIGVAVVAVPIGLRSYASSGLGVPQQDAINDEVNGKKIALGMRRRGDSFRYDFDYDLYVMNTDGSKPTLLAYGVEAAWSSDGKKLAFVRYVDESNPSSASAASSASPAPFVEVPYIFVVNANGSDQKQLLDRPAVHPTWSPDDKEIAFSYYLKDAKFHTVQGYASCGIYVTNADGSGEPRKLKTGPGCAYYPSWSPDGNKIAYTSGQGRAGDDIYVTNVSGAGDTNEPRPLTDYSPESASSPSWSPDGTEIAFTHADESGNTTIYKMDADGSGETPLTHNEHMKKLEAVGNYEVLDEQTSPTWSPDGGQIAYIRIVPRCDYGCSADPTYSLEPSEIYKMNSDGSNPTLVRNFGKGSELWGLDWQPLP